MAYIYHDNLNVDEQPEILETNTQTSQCWDGGWCPSPSPPETLPPPHSGLPLL